jgi:UDP-N-acetylglucosamine--N-acetylmuramyl-(pentapeptide) pyrophosphoryl-undecaprenol N-acetylglucosamine transferase
MQPPAKTIVLAGGGTGGHFYPALAVAEVLRQRADVELRYVGTSRGPEKRLAEAHGLAYESVPSGQVRGKSALTAARSLASIAMGAAAAARKLGGAGAVFATGGYASVPIVTGAWLRRVPVLVFLPDVEPGAAVRSTVRLATRIGVSDEAACATLPREKAEVTGYPVRSRFFCLDRSEARRTFGLSDSDTVVLISGASTGAQRLNAVARRMLPELLERAHVLHSTGVANFEEVEAQRNSLPQTARERYHVYPLIEDMPAAMHAADLAIMRAGASVLGEVPASALPAVLVPGTFAGGHQKANAEALARTGAALVLDEAEIEKLGDLTLGLLADRQRREQMSAAARAAARPAAASRLAEILMEIAR